MLLIKQFKKAISNIVSDTTRIKGKDCAKYDLLLDNNSSEN